RGDDLEPESELPGAQRSRPALPGEPVHRGRVGDRGAHRGMGAGAADPGPGGDGGVVSRHRNRTRAWARRPGIAPAPHHENVGGARSGGREAGVILSSWIWNPILTFLQTPASLTRRRPESS